ncbi:hypothetical protein DFQ28_001878 [Apophysomyces sp. BC1034]|nr:hypothetical protein DFQ30_002290 [Apophysomyces sp. BC1015]KAG0180055.1 hypothetical protein DFQ29_001276 [Apophysomyces sp. BC1021]KAG0190585.1 hypothetical protein DFQ28_001878 [Apophysomyces sp. BC1034]
METVQFHNEKRDNVSFASGEHSNTPILENGGPEKAPDDREDPALDGGYGVMQDYYEQHNFRTQTAQLTFVGTTANILIGLFCPFAQIVNSLTTTRKTMFMAIMLIVVGLELASFSTKMWHLYLTQGVLYGIGSSVVLYIVMSEIPQWFSKRCGIALGISSAGSCIGGLAMPMIMTPINNSLGASW